MSTADGSRWRWLLMLPVRWSGLALAAGLFATGHGVQGAVAMLVALAQVVAWRSPLPQAWEIALSASALLAAISSYRDLYARIPWWDVPVHALLTGLLAVLAAVVVRRPRPGPMLVAGAVLAVIWELLELWGHLVVDPSIDVRPIDTAGDLLSGMIGTAIAALIWRRTRARGSLSASPGAPPRAPRAARGPSPDHRR